MEHLARLNVWSPNIEDNIQSIVQNCDSCLQVVPNGPALPTEPWPAARHWERAHLGFGSLEGRDFVSFVDSKWVKCEFLRSTTSDAIIRTLF